MFGLITIIAGSRAISDYSILLQAVLDAPFDISEVVSGGARGAGNWNYSAKYIK